MHIQQADFSTAIALVPELRQNGVVYVAEDEGCIIGYAAGFTDGKTFYGHDLYSSGVPQVCSMLLQKLRSVATDLGYEGVYFDTNPQESPLYRLGGKRVKILSERKDDAGNIISVLMMLPKVGRS